jgi:hypothetical protein
MRVLRRLSRHFADFRNRLDFGIRERFRWRRPGAPPPSPIDQALAREVGEFLECFDWAGLAAFPRELRIADIGAKNFFAAPALDRFFRSRDRNPEIHGIEIDAFRRYRDGWTRRDYGELYAGRIPRGFFHATDFRRWGEDLDLALLLNPFVTPEALIGWGLPLSLFDPESLFRRAAHLLRPRSGCLLVSCPTEQELAAVLRLAEAAGFRLLQRRDWLPPPSACQGQPRLGALFALGEPTA